MTKRMACAAALSVLSFSAQAADLPTYQQPTAVVVPPFTWTGVYIGGELGWAQTRGKYDLAVTELLSPSVSSSQTVTRNGAVAGVFAGYNYQVGQMVLGAEADIAYLGVGDERYTDGFNYITGHTDWIGSVRGRLGYAVDRGLVYATGGLAFASADTKVPFTAISVDSPDGTRWGWTLGAGAEYALTDHWIAGVEYRYTQYQTDSYSYSFAPDTLVEASQKPSINQVTARVSYKF